MTSTRPRLVVGISGSSAPQYGIALLEALRKLGTVETHLVVSAGPAAPSSWRRGGTPTRCARSPTWSTTPATWPRPCRPARS
ncbi:hypothetical protein ACFQHO_44535 [Actinomadura yumaensis]|uniref:hypothetical protein n=1 Tax=Actinomadura yumaensis TaxID=111807 RepID=UPI00361263F1